MPANMHNIQVPVLFMRLLCMCVTQTQVALQDNWGVLCSQPSPVLEPL